MYIACGSRGAQNSSQTFHQAHRSRGENAARQHYSLYFDEAYPILSGVYCTRTLSASQRKNVKMDQKDLKPENIHGIRSSDKNSPDKNRIDSEISSTPFTKGLTFRMSVGVVLFIVLVIASNYVVTHTKGKEVISEQASKLNRGIGENIILKLRQRLASAEALTKALAELGHALPKNEKMYRQVIPAVMDQSGLRALVAGGGIWPEPGVFDPDRVRRSFFWGRNEAGQLEFYDDYNDPKGSGYHNEEWYVPARYLKQGQVYWSKSYMDPYSLEPMVTCTVPIWDGDVFQGVATIDLRLTGLSDFMAEQANLIGGYAFALDRNNRLLSFPTTEKSSFGSIDLKNYTQNEYPTIDEVARINRGFVAIEKHLSFGNEIAYPLDKELQSETDRDINKLARIIAEESYQIGINEAEVIARLIKQKNDKKYDVEDLLIEHDPVLAEPTSVRVLDMPDIGWKVVIAMPARYSTSVVDDITETVLSQLLVILMITAALYMIFFHAAFLLPVNNLTQQVRNLVSREDYITRLKIKGQSELAQLAKWFNVRTNQLAEALEKLQQRNLEINEAREVAEQANRSKNIFLASMSHDIRTPMNAIIGMTEVLHKTKLDSEQNRYVNVINSSSQSLLSLINDIMDFSKIEANQLDLEHIPFDLRHVLDDCADLIYFQAAEKRLEFVYYISPEIQTKVIGDPNRIRQIILNLTTNAVKFTATGRVELWLESIHQSEHEQHLLVEVRDTGIGLSRSAQQKLFTPFAQGDSSTTRKYGGTGLGLAICKHLAELLGGNIEFRSEENVGTTFIFKTKLRKQKTVQIVPQLSEEIEKEGVYLLGKNHYQNGVLEQYLTSLGVRFTTCENITMWLSQIERDAGSVKTTLSADVCAILELSSVSGGFAEKLKEQNILVFAAQDDVSDIDKEKFQFCRELRCLTLPVKLDQLYAHLARKHLDKSSEQANEASSSLMTGLTDAKILVVEDNKVNQQVLMIMLGFLGLSADIANDGVEAVEAAESQEYDVILMDWQMPRMDGLEATRIIKAQFGDRSPFIIAVTANAMSGDIDKCLDAGMDDYLSKPIQKDKLENTLRKWLSKRKSPEA